MHETYWSLMTNVPHLEFEVTLSILQDALIFMAVRVWSRREHRFHNTMHVKHKQKGNKK